MGLARKSKIVCIVGPTAARKSRIALTLAEALGLNAAIISADAFQAYRELNVGVNKPSLLQRSKIVHHFVDCVSIDEE